MAAKRDYYEVLELSRDATEQDLKRSYRRLAMQYHPDRNPGDQAAEAKFKEVSEAYGVLSDPGKRQQYDRFGHSAAGANGGFQDFGFGDIFEAFFGGANARQQHRPVRGQDLSIELLLEFEEALSGTTRQIEIKRLVRCAECGGSGARGPDALQPCANCRGSGEVRRTVNSFLGQVVNVTACGTCRGRGQVIVKPCPACHGEGRVHQPQRLEVKVPAGVDNGAQIRLSGEGEAGPQGGSNGDLYVVLRVKEHPDFERRDDDLYCELRLNIAQAALGDKIETSTPDGPMQLTVPSGTQPGQVFKLSGRGMPNLRTGRRGSLYVVVRVVIPTHLSEEQTQLLQQFGGLTGHPEKVNKSLLARLKQAISLD